jgi:hypothetical protein
MKVWVCDECGKEVSAPRPEKCQCGAEGAFIEIEKSDGSVGCKGPGA